MKESSSIKMQIELLINEDDAMTHAISATRFRQANSLR